MHQWKRRLFLIVTHLKKALYDIYGTLCRHYHWNVARLLIFAIRRDLLSNTNIISLSKNQFYKHNRTKFLTSAVSVLFWLLWVFYKFILISSIFYFCIITKVFDLLLSGCYNARQLKLSRKRLTYYSAITSTKLWSLNY